MPTPKRLKDARDRGQVARSTDIVTALSLGAVLFTVAMTLGPSTEKMIVFTEAGFRLFNDPGDAVVDISVASGKLLAQMIFPIIFAALGGAVLGNVIQFGFIFASKALKPDISKLNPFNGFKRIFSMKTLLELVKSIIKITALGVILYVIIRDAIGPLSLIPFSSFDSIFAIIQPMLLHFIFWFVMTYVGISLFDFVLQKKLTLKELMMTKDETKREFKEMEGDPEIKGERKKLARELTQEDAGTATKKSNVLVTNPTHYAVGIYFEQGKMKLPVVRVKGEGFVALRLIQIAREHGVPVVENPPLARALHEHFKVKQPISTDYLAPVAEILKWVASLPKRV